MNTNKEKHITTLIKSICGNLSIEEQKQAELNFLRYINLAERISQRLEREKSDTPLTENS
tara:strand:+ start:23008 stop:23187 length:180 start_codon:yes stop_codon:yes gene_type:complete